MGKILVIYDSKTGNTAQMAEYVAEGARSIDGINVRLLSVEDATVDDVLWAEGIACGTPTYVGIVSWKMKKFWDDISQHPAWGKMDGKIE